MPDFEVVQRIVIRVEDPYATQDQVRTAFSVTRDTVTPVALLYTVIQANEVAVRKVSS